LPKVGLRARFLPGAFFRGIELPCQLVAPLPALLSLSDPSNNIANGKKKKEEERKITRIILLYLAKSHKKPSVAE